MNEMIPSVIDEVRMTSETDARIRRTLVACFPADASVFSVTRAWHGCHPSFSVVLESNDEVAAHVGVVDREVSIGTTTLRVAGIQNVCVRPAHRGKQLSEEILRLAMQKTDERGFDLGLLFCVAKLVPFYSRCGWIPLPGRTVTISDPLGATTALDPKQILMFFPLRVPAIPDGPIDLEGMDW